MPQIKVTDDLHLPGPRHANGSSAASPKNRAIIEPLHTPELYARHFDGGENRIVVATRGGGQQTFEFQRRIDDRATSLAASVFKNPQTGHAIILYKGMDKPGFDEGSGRKGAWLDYQVARAASNGTDNGQTAGAEKIYLDTLNDPSVKSVEIVGYSIGSLHLNTMAAKYGAKGTAIADMGISDQVLTSVFNKGSGADQAAHSMDQIASAMRDRVTTLKKDWDKMPEWYAASAPRGTVIQLDQGRWTDLLGIAHIPQVYKADADIRLQSRATPPRPER